MRLLSFVVPPFYENTYTLVLKDNRCVVVDPGGDGRLLLEVLRGNRCTPLAVLLTHGHIDHVSGLEALLREYPDVGVWLNPDDQPLIESLDTQARMFSQTPPSIKVHTRPMLHQEQLRFGELQVEVIHTPGHTPGSVSLYLPAEGVVFTGDTLFMDSVGRTDLWLGDHEKLMDSILNRLFSLPPETVCLPGHGPKTTIEREKTHNPFVGKRFRR